jgi:glycosyltransferase involved in cell wall biosynthesis
MKVLMFGWEFPPNISGGLGTACYGITKSLSSLSDVDITFVIPKAHGNEQSNRVKLIGANQIDLIKSKIHLEKMQLPIKCFGVESKLIPYIDPVDYETQASFILEDIKSKSSSEIANSIKFSGEYGPNLMNEIHNFSVVGEYIASQTQFDVIHAHDWLTFPAGIAAKKLSGKPLVIHVHATDFDRSGGKVNPLVYQMEKEGMQQADCIVCVSNRTREIVINNYGISADKTTTIYNGVDFEKNNQIDLRTTGTKEKTVTFLGRITRQKGPEYFIKVAKLVLDKMAHVKFVMAGSGDLYYEMVRKVAKLKMADRFIFTGFLKGDEVCEMMKLSDVFVMPSVSEPFGICPLEAMQSGVPVIISKQSGVSEVVKHAIKTDFWDVHAMADTIHGILSYPALAKMMVSNGKKEVIGIKWEDAADKIHKIYQDLLCA